MFSNSGKSVFSRYLKYFCSTKNTNISFKMVRMSHHFIVQKSNSQRNSCGFIIWKYCYKSRSMFKSFSQEYTFISVISYTFWSSFSQFYTKSNVSITSKNNSFLIFSWKIFMDMKKNPKNHLFHNLKEISLLFNFSTNRILPLDSSFLFKLWENLEFW